MHFIVVRASRSPRSPSEFTRTFEHSADYVQALALYRAWERAVPPDGFVVLAEIEGTPDALALEFAARNITPQDDALIRSCLGPVLAQDYASRSMPGVALSAQDFASLNRQKYLLLRLLDGERLSDEDLITLGGLVDFIDAVQDSASAQGVPDGVIWPNIPFGSGTEEEARLSLAQPDLAAQLIGTA